MQTFINDCRTLLNNLPALTGDHARLAHRLSQAVDIIESDRAAIRGAYDSLMKRYDQQAINRLRNQLQTSV